MEPFSEKQTSKETAIRRLNGKLRLAVWIIAVLVSLGTIAGGVYWRRTILKERASDKARESAVDLILKGMAYRDSVEIRRDSANFARLVGYWEKLFDHFGIDNHRSLPMPAQERADTAYLRGVFEKQKQQEED